MGGWSGRPFSPNAFPISAPPKVRVLIVTDNEGSFTPPHRFALTEFVKALEQAPLPFVDFVVKRAHRPATNLYAPFAADADYKDFGFSDEPQYHTRFEPSQWDVVFLFGVGSPTLDPDPALTDRELRTLSAFMNAGGGVFATGDHEDLGALLCGKLPRVRSMRKWQFDTAVRDHYETFDPTSGSAPPVVGEYRHDTLRPGGDSQFQFDDQSDDIPQDIIPTNFGWGSPYKIDVSFPHPLLCGPRGTIRVLPDHMHEGECLVPADLSKDFRFLDVTGPEYPLAADGSRPQPVIVARCLNVSSHLTRLERKDLFGGSPGQTQQDPHPDVPVAPTVFGAIGAYNGHMAGVGRVAVDSTFHHFMDVNLNGNGSNSSDPVKQKALYASADGLLALEQIQAYYRNLAVWLAPPALQRDMANYLMWFAVWDSQIKMLRSFGPDTNLSGVQYAGVAFLDVLARLSSRCTSVYWLLVAIDPLSLLLGARLYELLHRPDPPPDPVRTFYSRLEMLEITAGYVLFEIFQASNEDPIRFGKELQRTMPQVVARGTARGLREVAAQHERLLDANARFMAALRARADELEPGRSGEAGKGRRNSSPPPR
jgi:hypothetical protein